VNSQAISSPRKIITSQDIHYKAECILKLCPSSRKLHQQYGTKNNRIHIAYPS